MIININELKEKDIISYNLVKASWLQKSIRRGLNKKALSIAKLYMNDNQEKGLIRRLKVFATEDIGLGNINTLIEMKNKNYDYIKVINLLCQSKKNREIDRFLLQVERNFEKYKKIDCLKKETYNLKKLLSLSEVWFNKKNKINKEAILSFIEALVLKYNSNDFQKELASIAVEHYFELSKFKTLGARTNLAFIVLLIVRNISSDSFKNNINYNFYEEEHLDVVDDWAIDKHTPFGKKLNRGEEFWLKYGSVVSPEVSYDELFYQDIEKYPYL